MPRPGFEESSFSEAGIPQRKPIAYSPCIPDVTGLPDGARVVDLYRVLDVPGSDTVRGGYSNSLVTHHGLIASHICVMPDAMILLLMALPQWPHVSD